MKQEYKDTFDQLSISDKANEKLHKISSEISCFKTSKRPTIMKWAYALLIIVIVSVPTVTVLAANGIDISAVFRDMFGEKIELIQENMSTPEVNILSNTFENIDLEITGIAGDNKLLYITMDITKKDGSIFHQANQGFSDIYFNLMELHDKLMDSNNEKLDFNFDQSSSQYFTSIPNDDINGRKLSFAFVINIETEIEGHKYFIPGETYYLKLSNDNTNTGSEFGKGTWEGEFVANYTEAESINLVVNQIAKLPRWGTDDDYIMSTEMLITDVELSPFALRFTCEKDFINRDHDYWYKLYFEMDDGSIVGIDSYETQMNYLLSDSHKLGHIAGAGQIQGPYKRWWVFSEPLDVSKVKTINIGDLSIDFDND